MTRLFQFILSILICLLWLALVAVVGGAIVGGVVVSVYPDSMLGKTIKSWCVCIEKKLSPESSAPVIVLKEAPAAEEEVVAPPQPTVGPTFFTEEYRLSGRPLTDASLKGKVVLVYVWDVAKPESVANLSRVQDIWVSFKHKPFLVIGSHRGEASPKIQQLIKKHKITFPMYEKAGLAAEPKGISAPAYYMTDHTGKLIYRGRTDRGAIEAMINAFGQML